MKWRTVSLLCIAVLVFLVFSPAVFSQTSTVEIDARVQGCGDSVIETGEDCDTLNLNNKTCSTQGFTGGTLSCTAACAFNTSSCTVSSGGGGGGGSSNTSKSQVVLSGRAYPKSTITILKDAQVVATTVADTDARFQVNISGLSSGSYIFSVYGEDARGLRSSLLSFPVAVTKGILAKIENIFIAPTITTDKSTVKKGDPIAVFGQSTPASEITLEINSAQQIFVKAQSDNSGIYLHNLDTSILEMGQHHAKSRSSYASAISSQSNAAPFTVGNENILGPTSMVCPTKADLNTDCAVSLVDFSIAAFWYNRILSESFALREREKLNGDGRVNITDFSIMAFYWTG
jgi:hypothetical protein